MSLSSGTRLGTYEITHALGAGGMGEVYRARDSKLGRSVAIKVILEAFGADSDRIARFEREAKVLASINHPNIAALYGMEQSGGQHFLVMELVEGETLAERLRRGPIEIESALAIATQIAEALEAAHEKGIIHRDLKPANIKITPDEKVKVLDFGLAKAMETEAAASNVANSPTLSMMATSAGVVLGTAAYMSPEQAKGFAADHRSDVFSFGVVLYEMVTGRQPFQGETAPEILASVLVREPELHRIPADLNPRIHELLRRCLEKSPKRRWQAIGDVRAEIEAIAVIPRAAVATGAAVPVRPLWRRAIPVVAAALLAAAAGAAAAWYVKPPPPREVTRFAVSLPEGQQFSGTTRHTVGVSPDGRYLVYAAGGRLHLRRMSSGTPTPITGTEAHVQPLSPIFSPDGESIAFYALADRTLKRIAVSGGAAITVCPIAESPFSMSWSDDGILYGLSDGVMRVSPNGGKPEKIVSLGTDERVQRAQMLPGGRTVIYTVSSAATTPADRWATAKIVAQSIPGGERKTLVERGSDGRYVPTGHLLYVVGGTLHAVRFDRHRLEVTGGSVSIVEGVRRSPLAVSGAAWFDVSRTGSLVYVAGPATLASSQLDLAFIDRKGTVSPLKLPPASYDHPRISPDGRKIAVGADDGREAVILIYDLTRGGALQRSTFGGKNRLPIWTSDSRRVVFQSDRDGDQGIFWQPADGSSGAERLTKAAEGEVHVPESWHPNRDLLFYSVVKGTEYTLWMYSVRDRKATPFGVRSNAPTDAVVSPDGKWVAYSSGDSAVTTVYVQPFPATGAMYQLVREGSESPHHPVWSSDGKALLVNSTVSNLALVGIATTPTFAFGSRQLLPKGFSTGPPSVRRMFDMAPDDRIVGLITPGTGQSGTGASAELNVVLNWFEELKARAPGR